MKKLVLRYDKKKLKFTKEFILAIEDLLYAEIEMMRKNYPESAEDWHCGGCKISNLDSATSLSFMYGSKADVKWIREDSDIFIIAE